MPSASSHGFVRLSLGPGRSKAEVKTVLGPYTDSKARHVGTHSLWLKIAQNPFIIWSLGPNKSLKI